MSKELKTVTPKKAETNAPAAIGIQIALLLLNAQKITVAADVFEFQLKKFNQTWAAEGWGGSFEIERGMIIFNSK